MSPARAAAEAAVRTSKAAIVKLGHAALKNTALAAQAGSLVPAVQAFGPPGLVDASVRWRRRCRFPPSLPRPTFTLQRLLLLSDPLALL